MRDLDEIIRVNAKASDDLGSARDTGRRYANRMEWDRRAREAQRAGNSQLAMNCWLQIGLEDRAGL